MEEKLLVGYDLGKRYTQISCFNRNTLEPDTIGTGAGEENISPEYFLIPTVLAVTKEKHDWLFGREAVKAVAEDEAVQVGDMLAAAADGQMLRVYGKEFSPEKLLEKFFRKTLSLLNSYVPSSRIGKLVVTVEKQELRLVSAICNAMAAMGINKNRLSIIGHTQSFFYYALAQKKELWINDIGLFEYGEDGLRYCQLALNHAAGIAGVQTKDYSNTMPYDMLSNPQLKENLPVLFSNIAQTTLHRQVVSTLYMTGQGFAGKWADDIFRSLCVGRRVFKGMNLYCAGACYAAREYAGEGKMPNFLFLGGGVLHHEIIILAQAYGREVELSLAQPAKPWYEQKFEVELILYGENEVELCIRDILKKEETVRSIVLTGLPKRPERMTRILIKSEFLDESHFVVTIHDEGFGEFYPSSDRIWEKIVEIG